MRKSVITSSQRRRKSNPKGRLALIPIAAALVVAAAIFLLKFRSGRNDTDAITTSPVPVANQDWQSNLETGSPVEQNDAAIIEEAVDNNQDHAEIVEAPNDAGEQSAAQQEGEQEAEKTVKPPPHFRGPAEHLLSMVMSVKPGMVMPPVPLPSLSEESTEEEIENAVAIEEGLRRDLAIAMTNDIVIYETDSAALAETKEAVAEAKAQLAKIVANGGSVTDAIREYEAHVNEGAKLRSEVIEKITPEVDAIEDDAKALEYVESVNEALKKEDIPPIKPEEVGFEETDAE